MQVYKGEWVKKSGQSIKKKSAGYSEGNPHIRENLKKKESAHTTGKI